NLYVGFRAAADDPRAIVAPKVGDGAYFSSDEVEVFVDIDPGQPGYLWAATNPAGHSLMYDLDRPPAEDFPGRRLDAKLAAKARIGPGGWTAELAIPFACFAPRAPRLGDLWRFNLTRSEAAHHEISQWNCTFAGNHAPSQFGTLAFVPAAAFLRVQSLTARLGRNKARVEVNSPVETLLRIEVETAASSGHGERASRLVRVAPGKPQAATMSYPLTERGAWQVTCRVGLAEGGPVVASSTFALEVPPRLKLRLDREFVTDYQTRLWAECRVAEDVSLKGTRLSIEVVSAADGTVARRVERPKHGMGTVLPLARVMDIDIPIRGLASGKYRVSARLSGPAGEELGQSEATLQQQGRPRVALRDDNVLLADGTPFFPIGVYYAPRGAFAELHEAGVNVVHLGATAELDQIRQNLDAAQGSDLKVLFEDLMSVNLREHQNRDPAMLRSLFRDYSLPFANHPALLCWYVADEPMVYGILPDDLRSFHRIAREEDPAHPTMITEVPMFPLFGDNAGGADITATDPYFPWDYALPITHVADSTDRAVAAVRNRRPVWVAVQAWKPATLETIRCCTYLALIHGARGMLYFTYGWREEPNPDQAVCQAVVKQVATELRELTPVLLTPGLPHRFSRGRGASFLHGLLKKHDGKWFLIVANSDPVSHAAVTLALPKSAKGKAEVLFEERALMVKNGILVDDFGPYAVHVYRLGT
ncbi:MAG: hypothetical protein HY318_19215, partial [Armatimonadetes bacterium]|nr:hypothetical protein [Armatimonadota bacterium]